MSLIVFQHHGGEDAAVLGRILQAHGHTLRTVELFARQSMPADLDDVDGVICMGGPMDLDHTVAYPWLEEEMRFLKAAFDAHKPMLGVCLGAQLICRALGGQVAAADSPEVGWHPVRLAYPGTIDPIFAGIRWESVQFHLHQQQVSELPADAAVLGGSASCPIQAFRIGLTAYGFQYHFEWTRQDMQRLCRDGLAARAGFDADRELADGEPNYAGYRRLGDRLCENLATLLFAIDKR